MIPHGAARGHRNGCEPKKMRLVEGMIWLQGARVHSGLDLFESVCLESIGERVEASAEVDPIAVAA